MSSLELVTVVLVGVAFLGETLSAGQWAGIALVLGGIALYRPAVARSGSGSKT
jgi:drug/metabolite transporter (DMT)-like permease